MSTFQAEEVTNTTDSNGYFDFTFDNNIDKVMVSANSPQVSPAVISAVAVVSGAKKVTVRVWRAVNLPDAGSIEPVNVQQVTVTLLGITG